MDYFIIRNNFLHDIKLLEMFYNISTKLVNNSKKLLMQFSFNALYFQFCLQSFDR